MLLPRYSSSRVALRPRKTTSERGRRSASCVLLPLPTSYFLPPLIPFLILHLHLHLLSVFSFSCFSFANSYSRHFISLFLIFSTSSEILISLSWLPRGQAASNQVRLPPQIDSLRRREGNHRMYREYALSKFQGSTVPAV